MDKHQAHNQNQRPQQPPHKALGRYLKTMRQRIQESLGETSGAVEIAVEQLDRFERGAERPSEDILMLLISHFGLQDDEAVKVWELAGYDTNSPQFADISFDDDQHSEPATQQSQRMPQVVVVALDSRVLYSDGVNISGDNAGLVLSFLQSEDAGRTGRQPNTYPVSRIGMSYEQAERLLSTLEKALLHRKYLNGPKQLPPQTGQ